MRDVLKRLEALEQSAKGPGPGIVTAIHFVAMGEEWNPRKASSNLTAPDDDPKTLHRETGESAEAFQQRAAQAFPTGLRFLW